MENTLSGQLAVPENAKFCLIATRFNALVVDSLIKGAQDSLLRQGLKAEHLDLVRVPGAFEMPLVAQRLAATKRYHALIALGCVIRGGTPHFEYVAGECAKGLGQVSLQHDIVVSFGVLTTDTMEQALERAGLKGGNKGEEAAVAAIETVSLLAQLK